jgi:DNA repair exonuclease SbcCD ATPase subunit
VQRSSQQQLERLSEAHRTALEDKDRRISNGQMALARAEKKVEELESERENARETISNLGECNVRLGVELHDARQSRLVFKSMLAVASARHAALREKHDSVFDDMKKARMQHAEAETALATAKAEAATAAKAASEAADAALAASQAAGKTADAKAKQARTSRSVECNTEPMQEPKELTSLRVDYAALHEKKEAQDAQVKKLEAEVTRLETKNARAARRPPPPASFSPANGEDAPQTQRCQEAPPQPSQDDAAEQQPCKPMQRLQLPVQAPALQAQLAQAHKTVQMASMLDPATEALIHQTTSAIRALADLARTAPIHKNAADCLASELSMLRQVRAAARRCPRVDRALIFCLQTPQCMPPWPHFGTHGEWAA